MKQQLKELISIYSIDNTLKVLGLGSKEDYVIYSPHWSLGNTPLKYATFDWNGRQILEFAKSHPEIKWVFKPYPILKGRIVEVGLMSEEEVGKLPTEETEEIPF